MAEQQPARTFAELLDHLFKEVHPPSRGPFTYAEVAQGIREAAGEEGRGISASAIQQLRTGQKTNPTRSTIMALAGFFGVPAAYFFDDDAAARTRAEIAALASMRDQDVRSIAMRAQGLSTESLAMLTTVINQARRLEGLPDDPDLNLDE